MNRLISRIEATVSGAGADRCRQPKGKERVSTQKICFLELLGALFAPAQLNCGADTQRDGQWGQDECRQTCDIDRGKFHAGPKVVPRD